MTNLMLMGEGGAINPERVVMIGSLKSAPVKRLLKHTAPDKVINMTYGYPQRSLVIFDNGMVAITRYDVDKLSAAMRTGEEIEYDEGFSF